MDAPSPSASGMAASCAHRPRRTTATAADAGAATPRRARANGPRPGRAGLARAWVSGELDVDGDLERALALTEDWRHAPLRPGDALPALRAVRRLGLLRRRSPSRPPSRRAWTATATAPSATPRRSATTTTSRTSSTARMLGPTMVYSCAYFGSPDDTLDEAQTRKLDLICRKLELAAGERLLDIGCGWGSLLIHAAREYGVRGVGVTVSQAQARARARAHRARPACPTSSRCACRTTARSPTGPTTRSPASGCSSTSAARTCRRTSGTRASCSPPTGCSSTTGSCARAASPSLGSFSERYVFPDGELHTQGVVLNALEDAGFEVLDDESLRPHYAETLRRWAANHDEHRDLAIAEIGEQRERVWRLHNVGAALGFERGRLSVHQVLTTAIGGARTLPLRVREYPASARAASKAGVSG